MTKSIEKITDSFEFRNIRPDETEQAIEIEQICFPANEACSPEHMRERVDVAPELFLVAIDKATGKIAGFLNGLATDMDKWSDDFFVDATLNDPAGTTVFLLGLDVLPEYRRQGLAREIVRQYHLMAEKNGKKKLVLTCLPEKVSMYEKFGFTDNGICVSTWGGEQWHEMTLE